MRPLGFVLIATHQPFLSFLDDGYGTYYTCLTLFAMINGSKGKYLFSI